MKSNFNSIRENYTFVIDNSSSLSKRLKCHDNLLKKFQTFIFNSNRGNRVLGIWIEYRFFFILAIFEYLLVCEFKGTLHHKPHNSIFARHISRSKDIRITAQYLTSNGCKSNVIFDFIMIIERALSKV